MSVLPVVPIAENAGSTASTLSDGNASHVRSGNLVFGSWVELRTERCRGGRSVTVAVNRRTKVALSLDDDDLDALADGQDRDGLHETLETAGFLVDAPDAAGLQQLPSHFRLRRFLVTSDLRWSDADKLVGWLYLHLAHRLWRRRWIVAQVVLAAAGCVAVAVAFRSGRRLALRPSAMHVPLVMGLSLGAIALHELSHGIAITRYGRHIDAIGFRLHLGSPSFYVESIESLLLNRKQRIVQAAAGPWAEWLFTSAVAVVLWTVPLGTVTPALQRFVVLNTFTILSNLLPFGGLDGALITADVLREPRLAVDARDALLRSRPRRPGDQLLVAYAVANALVSGALVVASMWLWFELFGGLLGALLSHGLPGLTAFAATMVLAFGPATVEVTRSIRRFGWAQRFWFRCQRRTRVRLVQALAGFPLFQHLDDAQLGAVAGLLELRRVRRNAPLVLGHFDGFVVGPSTVHGNCRRHASDTQRMFGDVVVVRSNRRLPQTVAVLPKSVATKFEPSRN